MADIILKDRLGVNQTYKGVEKVKLNTSDGETQIFSKGESIERIPIDLDFTEGDQTINAPEGYLVKSAIIRKPENLKPENIAKDVEIAGIVGTSEGGGGGGSSDIKYPEDPYWVDDVCFWDIDGNLILNVPMSEIPSLKSLPTPPEYEGLTFVRWNYTLEQIQATEYPLDVGALYKPTDGKTHLKINIIESSYRTILLKFKQTVDGGVSVDWGDGSAAETVSGTEKVSVSHQYSAIGKYEITLSVANECIMTAGWDTTTYSDRLFTVSSYSSSGKYLTGIYFGDRVELGAYSCYQMSYATHITLPINMTDIKDRTFYGCYNIGAIIVPDGVISIGQYAFYQTRNNNKNYCPKRFIVSCLPESVVSIGDYAFHTSYYYTRFVVPKNMTSLSNYMIGRQPRLCRLYFQEDKITTIGNGLSELVLLRNNCFANAKNLTTIGTSFMSGLKGIKSFTLPSVSTIPNNCLQESGVEEIIIPRSVTSIGNYFAERAFALRRIIVCGNITSVGSSSAYLAQLGLDVVFYSETPPTSDIINAFTNTSNGATRVYVPDAALSAYATVMETLYYTDLYPISEYNGTLPEPC